MLPVHFFMKQAGSSMFIKSLIHISNDRKLSDEEREEMKIYNKLADAYTPLVKGLASEFCNQLAYDAIQIHGGSGFMKDYPVERIYRDARITSIYEGTTQLQVVAAIRAVTTGTYLKQIREYENIQIKPELFGLRRTLIIMTEEYEKTVNNVTDTNDSEYLDFHARRLVEMAGNIIMGYLLLLDTNRDNSFKKSAEVYVKFGRAVNKGFADFIANFVLDDLGNYKQFIR